MHLPTLKQLRYFVALSEHQHFARAAAACFVSQSAFSVAIRDLETLLGAGLVDRTNKNVTITAQGSEVAEKARRVLQEAEELVALAEGSEEPLTGKLRLGVIPTIAPFLLPGLLPQLRKAIRTWGLSTGRSKSRGIPSISPSPRVPRARSGRGLSPLSQSRTSSDVSSGVRLW